MVNLNASCFLNVRAIDIKGNINAQQVIFHDGKKPVEKIVVGLFVDGKEVDKKEADIKAIKWIKFDYKTEEKDVIREISVVVNKLQNEKIDENNKKTMQFEIR
ncbi:MAG: hypothetical protein N2643_03600 [Endomicrobia bacterium]|nr:hypothetical protein [Endomicrobiia bacterium]